MIELCPGVKSLSMFLAADDAIDPTMLRMLGVLGHTYRVAARSPAWGQLLRVPDGGWGPQVDPSGIVGPATAEGGPRVALPEGLETGTADKLPPGAKAIGVPPPPAPPALSLVRDALEWTSAWSRSRAA